MNEIEPHRLVGFEGKAKEEAIENRLKFEQRKLSTLIEMKRTEEENSLEDGRRRWFNQEIESTRNEIRELIQELKQRGA